MVAFFLSLKHNVCSRRHSGSLGPGGWSEHHQPLNDVWLRSVS